MNGIFINLKSTQSQCFVLFLILSMVLTSCSEEPLSSSVIPTISLTKIEKTKDVEGRDSLLILGISYQDADGNIGLDRNDTFPPFNQGSDFQYNLFIDIRELKNGNKIPVTQPGTSDPENFNQRIPNLTPTGRNRHISGNINISLDATKNYLYPDTILCTLQLADRALNKSNVVETGVVQLSH